MVPYQEHPQTYPTELKLSYDPKHDAGVVFPLLISMAGKQDAIQQASSLLASVPQAYQETQSYYQRFFDRRMIVETPDKRINEALKWAEISIDQSQVSHGEETGLVAGYYESADSARPGYAWFFRAVTRFSQPMQLTRTAISALLAMR